MTRAGTPTRTSSTTSVPAAGPGPAPRSARRYDDAVDGVVVTVDRGRYTLLVDGRDVTAMKARPLGRKGVVVGDRVRVVGDVSGDEGSLARIVEVNERLTTLRRTADDDDPVERVIVANADQLVVVTALADPEPAAAADRPGPGGGVRRRAWQPLLCLTKSDLADPETLLATYRSLGVPWVVTQRGGDLAALRERLSGPDQRAARVQRRRQVDAGQRAGARRRPRGRHRQRGHRPRAGTPPRRRTCCALPDERRRLDHRHARASGPSGWRTSQPEDLIERVPRPRRDDRGLPARLHARRPTSRSAGSTRRSPPGRPTRSGWRRSGGCWPPAASRRTDCRALAPDRPGAGVAGRARQTSVSTAADGDHEQRLSTIARRRRCGSCSHAASDGHARRTRW